MKRSDNDDIPKYDDLFSPLLKALHRLGSSASVTELENRVAADLGLSEEQASRRYKGTTHFGYRLAWARNYLKRYGLIENSSRGIWSLTAQGMRKKDIDKDVVKRAVKAARRVIQSSVEIEEVVPDSWEEVLIAEMQRMKPDAFERLCQRILREAGFIQVTVTGRSGDGGIDGKGVVRLHGLLSFHMVFQCKRYSKTVSAEQLREFRGAMQGRADKGLFITTGTFSRGATTEANRDGVQPIDLINGHDLAKKMKELSLGVTVTEVHSESVVVDHDWFKAV